MSTGTFPRVAEDYGQARCVASSSFVENGRAQPSRQLLLHLSHQVDLPMAERNRLLLAGGFAPVYLDQPYEAETMRPLRESLRRLLDAHMPNPALIVDGLWNLIETFLPADATSAARLRDLADLG